MGSDPDGMFGVIDAEELHWGCAGIALAISGSGLAAAGLAASGTPEQIARWVPECFGVGDEIKLGAYAVTEAQRRLRRQEPAHDREARRRRVGPERDQGLHHQRRDRRRPRRRRHRRPRARPSRPGLVRDREGHPGPEPGQEGVEARHPRLAHRRGRPRGLPDPAREPARRDGEAGAQARARAHAASRRAAARTRSRPSSSPGRSSAPRRSGSPRPPTSGRSTTSTTRTVAADPLESALDESSTAGRPPLERQGNQQILAQVATEIEAARLLVQRAAWMGRNGIPLTGGQGSMSKLKAGQVAVWTTRTLIDLVGPYATTTRVPAREVVPRREDLRAVRGHRRDPAAGDLAHAGDASTASACSRPRRSPPRRPSPTLGGSVAAAQ